MKAPVTASSKLILPIDHHKIMGSRPHRLVLVWMIPEITQVRQQFVPVLPVVEIQSVIVVVHAVVRRIESHQAATPIISCTQIAL